MKVKEYEYTALLHENLINSIKECLTKEGFEHQEFPLGTNGKIIQTKKNKFIINIAFEAPINNKARIIIEKGEIWYDTRYLPIDAEIMWPPLVACSAGNKDNLDKMKINIFKKIDDLSL